MRRSGPRPPGHLPETRPSRGPQPRAYAAGAICGSRAVHARPRAPRQRNGRTWSMTRLDWFIVAFVAVMALFGFRRGFIVGVLSVGGFALGAFLGTRLGPLLLGQGSASPYAPAFGLVGALVAGAILAGGLEGVGWRLRRTLLLPGLGVLDGAMGA